MNEIIKRSVDSQKDKKMEMDREIVWKQKKRIIKINEVRQICDLFA